jgi:hypothetical protein
MDMGVVVVAISMHDEVSIEFECFSVSGLSEV